jgi:hypothetical protein
MRALDPRTGRVLGPKGLRVLVAPCRPQRLVLHPWLQHQFARLDLASGALWADQQGEQSRREKRTTTVSGLVTSGFTSQERDSASGSLDRKLAIVP